MEEIVQQHFDKIKNIEENLLNFIDEKSESDNNFQIFVDMLDKQKIIENKQEFKSFLYLLVQISNNYHQYPGFYDKIDKILSNYKESIQKYFQNSEIFHIFGRNKRILFFLIQNGLFTINQNIYEIFMQSKYFNQSYIDYFYPEIESFLPESIKMKCKNSVKELEENDIENFNIKRKIGQNDSYVCQLIRNDQVIDFISHVERTNTAAEACIRNSIYETNKFLLENQNKRSISLIEYSAFFGSQQIFIYLFKKNVKLITSIWPFVIHGRNPELIHFLEENKINTLNDSYQYLIVESLKCHHNELSNYFISNFGEKEIIYKNYLLKKHLKYYNFNDVDTQQFIQLLLKFDLFYFLCKYDYTSIVEFLIKKAEIDINKLYILNKAFLNNVFL